MNIGSWEGSNISSYREGALNVKDIATTDRITEEARHIKSVAKNPLTTWRNITQMKLIVQTVKGVSSWCNG